MDVLSDLRSLVPTWSIICCRFMFRIVWCGPAYKELLKWPHFNNTTLLFFFLLVGNHLDFPHTITYHRYVWFFFSVPGALFRRFFFCFFFLFSFFRWYFIPLIIIFFILLLTICNDIVKLFSVTLLTWFSLYCCLLFTLTLLTIIIIIWIFYQH